MSDTYMKYLDKYEIIVKETDALSNCLSALHSEHLQCKKGCDLCCMDYNIFPVEFYSILHHLKNQNVILKIDKNKDDKTCLFLKNHSCLIYKNRPVICRTHGLPLLYMSDVNEWELSNCELNFNEFDFDEFNIKNTFPMDKFNSKLFVLNRKFIYSFTEGAFKETDLIPVKKLAEHL